MQVWRRQGALCRRAAAVAPPRASRGGGQVTPRCHVSGCPAMAAHLSSGRVNLTLLREAGRRELREFLDKCAGSKVSGSGGRGARRGPPDASVPPRRPSCGTST